jgi:hypothetical protein
VVRQEAGVAKASFGLFAALARVKLALCGNIGISFGVELSCCVLGVGHFEKA